MTTRKDTMDPRTDALYNEKGEEGMADAFFCVEAGWYKAVLMAEKRSHTPSGAKRSKRVTDSFAGHTARELATNMRAAGWEPPKGLAKLCESARGVGRARR